MPSWAQNANRGDADYREPLPCKPWFSLNMGKSRTTKPGPLRRTRSEYVGKKEISGRSGQFLGHFLGFFHGILDRADHIEGGFRQMVIFAFDEALEAADGVLERHQHAW